MPKKQTQQLHLDHYRLLKEALDLMVGNNYQKALAVIQKSLWIYPLNPDAYFVYSHCLYWARQYQKSSKNYEFALKINPLCEIYQMPDKQAVLKIRKLVQKAIQFEQKILRDGNNLVVSTWYKYTIIFHQQTNYQRVQSIYQRLFTKFPQIQKQQSHACLGNYSNMLYDLGKYDKALKNYQIQISRDPNQMRFFSNCSLLYTIKGNYTKAEQYITIALKAYPERSNFLFNYATILAKMGRYQQSIKRIEQALKKDSQDPIYNFKFAAIIYLQKENNARASTFTRCINKSIKIFQKCIQKNSPELVNSNKRILSMKNIMVLKIFAQMLEQIQRARQKQILLQWKRQVQFLQIINDYFIVGQAGKLQLNQKFLQLIAQLIEILSCHMAANHITSQSGEILDQVKQQKLCINEQYENAMLEYLKKSKNIFEAACKKPEVVRLQQWPLQPALQQYPQF